MLLINGVITIIGLVLALVVYCFYNMFEVTGIPLILIGAIALYLHLFLSDVVEDWLIEHFNKTP